MGCSCLANHDPAHNVRGMQAFKINKILKLNGSRLTIFFFFDHNNMFN